MENIRNEHDRVQKSTLADPRFSPEDDAIGVFCISGSDWMGSPWEEWAPGVLNEEQMEQLIGEGFITYSGTKPKIDHSSMNLTLADEGYLMTGGSVKPSRRPYIWYVTRKTKLAKRLPKPKDGIYELERKNTYVFRLQEKLEAGLLSEGAIYGQATAKSSVGRVDVLARLIVDGMNTYESFDPRGLRTSSGIMYLEITPITFNVKVKVDHPLSQLRFFYGRPEDVTIRAQELFHTIFRDSKHADDSLTVSLTDASDGCSDHTPANCVAFRSKEANAKEAAIPLWKLEKTEDKPDPKDYWDIEVADENKRLLVKQDIFYILRSKEKLYVPRGIAIYCRASDETMGEMRIHYAGFVHPYFGLYREDGKQGTPLIFEVRGHQVPVSLSDGEKMATLIFYRMSADAPKLTKEKEDDERKGYGSQELKLSSFFNDWPKPPGKNQPVTEMKTEKGVEDGTIKAS